ncbi:sugar phosphate isomerase/epimerase family protein [Chthonomonas calidirosea]|uniref:sugar phosphate isomerase/epimerase family protein n=1 Tax=Chthonomonas calidirosea TaxID=454171 RepID=UPI0006EC7199|nr:sugar phosphate isomerase/epimerase [Chthonomonas calidirosea]CEK13131.1 sugar phosphate isomerase/epimerase [Chthonomonas calidirosea]
METLKPQVAVQLIVFGEKARNDIEGTLHEVAAAGYTAFEGGHLFAMYGEARMRSLLDALHLGVSGAHFGYGEYTDDSKVEGIISYAKALGIENVMCSGVAAGTVEGYLASAKRFNEVGRRLADEGIAFNYHNHDWEFKDLGGGTTGMQILAQETDPHLVRFNLDVFWLYYAGQNPAAFIREHAQRAGYFHFKDGRRCVGADGKITPEFLELGRGEVPLEEAYAAAQEVGARWIVVEQDRSQLPPLEAITVSRNYLRERFGI